MKTVRNYLIIALAVAIGLPSCKVSKDYARPDLALPSEAVMGLPTTEAMDSLGYVTFFTDEKLIVLIDTVLKNNTNLKIAAANLVSSEAMLASAKLNYLPDLNLQVSSSVQKLSENSMFGSFANSFIFEDYSLAPAISWDIDFWGKLKREREWAAANYASRVEARNALQIQLVAQTAHAYYTLLSLDQQLIVANQMAHLMEQSLAMVEAKYQVAEASVVAVKQLKAQVADVYVIVSEIKQAIQNQEIAIHQLAGMYPSHVDRSAAFLQYQWGKELSSGIPVAHLTNRPDVRANELQLQAANAKVGIAKADFYPTLRITAQGGLNSIKSTNWFSIPASLFGNAAAGLTQPIFNKKRLKANYAVAQQERNIAVEVFRQSVVDAVAEVATSLTNIEAIQTQKKAVSEKKVTLGNAIKEVQVLYTHGEADYLEVVNVQQVALQAELANLNIIQKEIDASIALYKALGGN